MAVIVLLLLVAYGAVVSGLSTLSRTLPKAPLHQSEQTMTKKEELNLLLARGINATERRFDSSIESVAELLGSLSAVRRDGKVGAEFGQPIIEHLTHAMPLLVQARGHVVQAHRLMSEIAPRAGFEPFTGEGPSKPADPPSGMVQAFPAVA